MSVLVLLLCTSHFLFLSPWHSYSLQWPGLMQAAEKHSTVLLPGPNHKFPGTGVVDSFLHTMWGAYLAVSRPQPCYEHLRSSDLNPDFIAFNECVVPAFSRGKTTLFGEGRSSPPPRPPRKSMIGGCNCMLECRHQCYMAGAWRPCD
jgi:hypothetical protein